MERIVAVRNKDTISFGDLTSTCGETPFREWQKAAERSVMVLFLLAVFVGFANSQDNGSDRRYTEVGSFVETISTIKQSIAPVLCFDLKVTPNGSIPQLRRIDGSSFFISATGTFVTAGHIIDDFLPKHSLENCPLPAVYVPTDPNWNHIRWFRFTPAVCVKDSNIDIAECRTDADLTDPNWDTRLKVVHIHDSILQDGTPIAFTGFPLGNTVPLTSIGSVARYVTDDNPIPMNRIIIDKNVWPGASGSPMYSLDGSIVGMILAAGEHEAAGIGIGRSSVAINAFLRAHPQPAPQQSPKQGAPG